MWNVITYLSKIGWNFIFVFIPDHMWATWNKNKCLYNAWMFLPLPCNYVYPLHTSCARVCLMSSLMDGRIPLPSYQINQMVNVIPNNFNLLYNLNEWWIMFTLYIYNIIYITNSIGNEIHALLCLWIHYEFDKSLSSL